MNIVQIFPGKIWGGAEQYITDLGTELTARSHNVSYVSRQSEPVVSHLSETGKKCETIPFSWPLDRSAVKKLARLIRNADVVCIHSTKFVPLTVLAKKKASSNARIILTRHEAHRTPANPFFRRYFRQLDQIVFVSEIARSTWMGSNSWFPIEKTCVVHNSIPPYEAIPVESLREKYAIAPDTPLLIFSGRVRESKGCGDIVRALSMLSSKKFAMVFLGACRPKDYSVKLMEKATKEGIADRIHFYGFTSQARNLMGQADIGLSPSIVRDSFLLSNIEFQQQGIPIVTTNNGGQPEYVTDGVTGLLVNPKNPEQLADAIDRLLTDTDLRNRIGRAGLDYFNANLSYDKFTDRIIEVYSGK